MCQWGDLSIAKQPISDFVGKGKPGRRDFEEVGIVHRLRRMPDWPNVFKLLFFSIANWETLWYG